MVQAKLSERRAVDNAFINSGYVLDFSDRTFAEWFQEELSVQIDDARYRFRGDSKGNRLRGFVEIEPAHVVARALRALWNYRQALPTTVYHYPDEPGTVQTQLFAFIDRLESGGAAPSTDAIVSFARDETLSELIEAIKRDAQAGKPAAALDRLHTFSMKKFAHLLSVRGIPADTAEPLHSRVGRYVKALGSERELRPITKQIFKNCVGIFQSYNDIRNNASFAHDNQIVEPNEARFIFDTIMSMLRFVRSVEADRFEQAA
ncbi:abortive infection family protein [uncultured Sphingomonas sp.]|uniref:abortive infection family protein n=1 Tax=uncultured Sphingomonas sp. TaxID=158754 RepID=UPI0035CA1F0B